MVLNKLHTKFKDTSDFSISCLIGNLSINRVLYDLGPSVSLIPVLFSRELTWES